MKRVRILGLAAAVALAAGLCGCRSGDCCVVGYAEGGISTLAAHRCLSVCVGTRTVEGAARVRYRGALLGLAHNSLGPEDVQRIFVDEQCEVQGLSVQLFAQTQVGRLQGGAVSGLMAIFSEVEGVQLSGLANEAGRLEGVQVALGLNRTEARVKGVQVGLVNLAEELEGVQVGLLNVNRAGWVVPLVNLGW